MHKRLSVGILFGGRSGEHEVSIASATSIIEQLDPNRYDVVPIGITKQGRWLASGDPIEALRSGNLSLSRPAALLTDPYWKGLFEFEDGAQLYGLEDLKGLDVIFPVLHGTYGEDGTVQGMLELAGIPYVGAGVLASAIAMDKAVFKDIMTAHDFSIVDYVAFSSDEFSRDPSAVLLQVDKRLGYPVFSKPANMGSSVGVSKCHDRQELEAGIREASRYDRKLLVEAAVPDAREIEVSVLGNDAPQTSVAGEVVPSREFYSYAAKYVDSGDQASKLLIPAPLPPRLAGRMRSVAEEAYKAIDCSGMARADFLLSGDTDTFYVNELNTIPGFTAISMYPKLWEESGLPYPRLIDRLIDLAIERHEKRLQLETSYEPLE
jgi:D-alanine-D-alanine ligase